MKGIVYEIKKHILIFFIFAKNSLIAQMEYRANFIINIAVECVFTLAKILYVAVVYRIGERINGMLPDTIVLYTGTFLIMTGFYTFLFMENFFLIPEQVRSGSLDFLIIKPVSLQFILTLRKINFALPIPNIGCGLIMVIISAKKLRIPISHINVVGYIGILMAGIVISYTVFLLPQMLSFWIVKTGSIVEIADKTWDFNNMPMSIYGKWMQRIGTFIFPVLVIVNFPSMFLIGSFNRIYALWAIVAPLLFMTMLRQIWKLAIKNYTSASS